MLARSPHRRPDTVAVLDIGTSKTICLIGQVDENFGVRLLGSGFAVSRGMKTGAVVDMSAVELCIRSAVQKAERQAGVAVHSVSVSFGTRSLRSSRISVTRTMSGGDVSDKDIQRLIHSSLYEAYDPEYSLLHAIPLDWNVDGQTSVSEPHGMFGRDLGVDMHFIHSGIGQLRNLAHCIERCHLRMRHVTATPYAAGLGVLTDDEKDLGVVLIDLGGGVTSYSIVRDNKLVHVDSVAVGGQNATQDIARGMVTTLEAAERIKLIYGSTLSGVDDDRDMVPCPPMGPQDTLHNEPKSLLTSILRSRTEETLEIVRNRILDQKPSGHAGYRIVLTGGGAHLSGMKELAEYVFNNRCRIGRPHGVMGLHEAHSGPEYAVAIGLLKRECMDMGEPISGSPDLTGRRYRQNRHSGNSFGRAFRWIKENF